MGLELLEKEIARTGYEVMDLDGNIIGEVTSGTQSPSSGKINCTCNDKKR